MTDASGVSNYTYDKNNRMLEIQKGGVQQIAYTYDIIGNIQTVTDSKGFATAYTYDRSNRMATVSFLNRTVTYSYDENGNRAAIAYAGGVREEYVYDRDSHVIRVTNEKPDGSVISKYTYTYDLADRKTTYADSYGTTKYTYDAAGRITLVETPGKTTAYAYDGAGNRLSQHETYTSAQPSGMIDGVTGRGIEYMVKKSEYVYAAANRLISLVERMYNSQGAELLQKTTRYIYDANGNELRQSASFTAPSHIQLRLAARASAQGDDIPGGIDPLIERTSNTFDDFNRLKAVDSLKGGERTVVEYSYNGEDLRVRKEVRKSTNRYEPEVTQYLYDCQHVILETDGVGAVKARYVRGIQYIARLEGENKLSYFLYNGHGDVVQTVSETGEVQNRYEYDIFGNPTLTIESYACAIRYSGEFMDVETGLYYLRARYYNPYTGRFISEDSYWGEEENPLSLNLYAYCHNDPVNFVDPTGHMQEHDDLIKKDTSSGQATIRMISEVSRLYGTIKNDSSLSDTQKKGYFEVLANIADVARADYIIENPNSEYAVKMLTQGWESKLEIAPSDSKAIGANAAIRYDDDSSIALTGHRAKIGVVVLQRLLVGTTDKSGNPYLSIGIGDYGVLGEQSRTAIIKFQKDNGLYKKDKEKQKIVDGIAGKKTFAALNIDGRKGQIANGMIELKDYLKITTSVYELDFLFGQNNNSYSMSTGTPGFGDFRMLEGKVKPEDTILQDLLQGAKKAGIDDRIEFIRAMTSNPIQTYLGSLKNYIIYNVGPQSLYFKGKDFYESYIVADSHTRIENIGGEIEQIAEIVVGAAVFKLFKVKNSSAKGTPKIGKITGSTNSLTTAEKQVVDDLVAQGKTVEIIPKDPQSKVKTPDFKIDGVKTELKTLQNPNINTGITRVQDGFKQSSVVIVDGRSAGLTKAQAIEIKNRAVGSYTSKGQSVPGKFEIWTNEGVVTYP